MFMEASPVQSLNGSDVIPPDEGTLDFDDGTLRAIAEVYLQEGNKEYRKKEPSNAIYFYTEGIKVNCKDDELNAKLYSNRATAHFNLGNNHETLNDAKAAISLKPTFIKPIEKVASACVELRRYEEAIAWCDKGLAGGRNSLYKTEQEARDRCREESLSGNLGNVDVGDFKKAIHDVELYLKNAKEKGDRDGERLAYASLGIVYSLVGDFKQAIEYHGISLKIAKDVGDLTGEVAAFGNLGNSYYSIGDFKTAIHYYKRQLEIAEKLGNRNIKKDACANLGRTYNKIADFQKALEYHKLYLTIAREMGDKSGEGSVYCNLGNDCHGLKDFRQAIYYHEHYLTFTKEVCDRAREGRAYHNLGNDYHGLRDLKKAIHYHELHLNIAKEIGDRAEEGRANGSLGNHYRGLGEFKKAIDHHELYLQISKEVGDRCEEGKAYNNLGKVYHSIGNFKKAIEYHELYLNITKDVCDRAGEGLAYNNLGNDYQCIGEFQKAIKYQKHCLKIITEVEFEAQDRAALCSVYCGLGNAYGALGVFKKAIDYYERCLEIALEIGDKEAETSACGGLGNAYLDLGNANKALEYHERELKLARQVGDQNREGQANSNLGNAYLHLRDFKKAIHHEQRHLQIAQQVGDMAGEGCAYSYLGNSYYKLGNLEKAKEYHGHSLKIAMEEGDKIGIGNAYGNLGQVYLSIGDSARAKDYHERHLKIAQETGDRVGEAKTYFGLGRSFELLGSLEKSRHCYQSSVEILNDIRLAHQFKDEWKISLRHMYTNVYTRLWLLLLKQEKVSEALFAAEQGRAQALKDLMEFNYGLETSSFEFRTLEEIIHDTFKSLPSVFTALHSGKITFWVIQNGKDVHLRRTKSTEDSSLNGAASHIESLVETVRKAIGVRSGVNCEDRSLEKLGDKNVTNQRCDQTQSHSSEDQEHPFRTLYDVAVSPIADLVNGDELIIVPEGPLWLAPYAAFIDSNSKHLCESFRIRVIPSLTSLKLIADCPADYHCKTGALLVGDPWVQEVVFPAGGKLQQLPCAKAEVEMIGRILNTAPLTGTEATKDEVLKRLSSVALIHIAAHGRMETGEIALAPNTARSSQIPTKEDFLLTMADVLNVKLRARLVVLSCCHSGRGDIKAEGVVGIARAFLGAGARSVLVSLWAIDDEATLEFMKSFYRHLANGRSAGEALNQAMNYMRESDQFSEVRFWAPFVLIGDDVTLDFGKKEYIS